MMGWEWRDVRGRSDDRGSEMVRGDGPQLETL